MEKNNLRAITSALFQGVMTFVMTFCLATIGLDFFAAFLAGLFGMVNVWIAMDAVQVMDDMLVTMQRALDLMKNQGEKQ